ncbi:MAG: hypothetical protein ACN4GZ_06865 [Acidimicrobiales bacterium]
MYATRRRGFPFAGLPLFVAGFILATLIGSAGSAMAVLLFVPLLMIKFMFAMFVIGAFMRLIGGGFARGIGGTHRPYWQHQHSRHRTSETPRQPTQEERDWAQARAEARQEIEDLFPDAPD